MTHLERFQDLKTRHPQGEHLASQFLGWMCGTAARAERDTSYRPSALGEVERFLACYEAELVVTNSESDPTPNRQ